MSAVRPVVTVFSSEDASKVGSVGMPKVFESPLRPDLVCFVADQMRLNSRQAYALSTNSGYQTAAESWGTGRAVSRIPRVPGGGTHRAGQAAFGNMCRGGGMFAPTKVWRKWHHKINRTQRRHATCAALAATALPSLVMSRGHRIDDVEELPLVVKDVEGTKRTKDAAKILNLIGLQAEIDAVVASKRLRAGKGKRRNKRFKSKKGPLVVYNKDEGMKKAFRNIPGIEFCDVNSLCLTKLAPGGHLGRLCVYTEEAFKALNEVYGRRRSSCPLKKGYSMPRGVMANTDLHRIINSDEVQSVTIAMKANKINRRIRTKNPLRNSALMDRINPGFSHLKTLRKQSLVKDTREWKVIKSRKERLDSHKKAHRSKKKAFYKELQESYAVKKVEAEEEEDEE